MLGPNDISTSLGSINLHYTIFRQGHANGVFRQGHANGVLLYFFLWSVRILSTSPAPSTTCGVGVWMALSVCSWSTCDAGLGRWVVRVQRDMHRFTLGTPHTLHVESGNVEDVKKNTAN